MPASVYATSYRKVIGSFRSSQGHLLTPTHKKQLLDYVIDGTIPGRPLNALLCNDVDIAKQHVKTPLAQERLDAVYEFIIKHFPTSIWRNELAVAKYGMMVKARPGLQQRYHSALRNKMQSDSNEPILID
jgi:hypothetical protein